jgi:tetraacyldisaccharide 4'-kinase
MNPISTLVLPPLSTLYGLITRARLMAYREGLLETSRLDVPVISVGNITTGGTGKTPLVEWVCRALATEGKKVCVLTRGYGRANSNSRLLVSDGREIHAQVDETGDEPLLLAQQLRGLAAVVCDADRRRAGEWAREHLGANAFVLDDGFQHLRLARDLNILTIDATNPWGGANLLPFGRLREPLSGASRSDCVVITRGELKEDVSELRRRVQALAGDQPIFISQMRILGLRTIEGIQADFQSLPGSLGAFCGVGNPESFYAHLRRQGIVPAFTHTFRDHHMYKQADIDFLTQRASRLGAGGLVTTAKDAVKLDSLQFVLPCYILEIQIAIEDEGELITMVRHALVRGAAAAA